MAKSNKELTKELRAKLIENLKHISNITKNVDWTNYQKAFNSMDDYVWIRISPKVHYAQPMGFSTREKERGRSGAYQVYVNPNIPKQFQVPVEMHEWGHILYTHLTLPKEQRNVLITKIRSYWPEIKLHLSDEVLKQATDDPKYGDYICDRLCNCILNIAMDFEVNSKLFEDFEKEDLIQYLSIAGCYSLAYASESSVEGLERALRWTEYQLGIRVPKEGKKATPLFMPCLPEDLGMPRGLEFEKYIDYMIIHDDEFFQYARNSLSKSTGLSGSPNTPQDQNNEDSGDEIDNNNSDSNDISDSSEYGKDNSSNENSGQQTQGNSNKPSLPELATEKQDEDQFDKDGGGMEDWNPSNDKKHEQNYQNQQNNQGQSSNSSSQNNSQDSDSGSQNDSNSDGQQSSQGQGDEGSQSNDSSSDSQENPNTDSLGRPIDDSHLDEDEMDSNGNAPASSDLSNAFNEDDKNENNAQGQQSQDSSDDSKQQDSKQGNGGKGNNKLTPEQIDNLIKAYDDGNLETNQERVDEANEESNNGNSSNYSPVGTGNKNSSARAGNKEDIIEIERTDKLEKFIVQCCFNKQHTDTRVDSMYYYNRRKFNSNRIITKKRTENRYKPGNVFLLVDVSGSVNEHAVNTIIHTVRKVANKCGHNSRAIFWDTELCGDYPLNKIDSVPCGGGTFMAKGIEYIREHYLHKSNDKLIIVSDFCDSLYHWNDEVKKLKGEAFGICWAYGFDKDISNVKEYLQDNSYGSDDYSVIDNLLKDMPTIIVDIDEE